ncbi:hypothetical protein [Streptomyces sp. MAR4 CNX-425]|uniref:hypothetical protein n=1 Tax=Streptomyces sp. MAR4 CNX-425 TaxID=3406343 RepID=UPI003B50D73E
MVIPARRKPSRSLVLVGTSLTLVGGLLSSAVPAATAAPPDDAEVRADFGAVPPGTAAPGWTGDTTGGEATVQDVPGTVDRSLRLRDTSTTAPVTAGTGFGTTSDTVIAGFRLRTAQTSATVGVHLDSAAGHSVTVALGDKGRWYTYDGGRRVPLGTYEPDRWYDVRLVARPGDASADLYVDGVRTAADLAFRTPAAPLNGIQAGVSTSGTGTAWLDDVRVVPESAPDGWRQLGTVAPRTAKEVGTSKILVGAETLDRDYADYDAYAPYLGRLGATGARIQGGWAKTEKTPGTYDWTWLDHIVEDADRRGVKPWVQLSYGNGAYPGGGGSGLGGRLPTSPEALAAWDRWVTAMVERYKDRVDEWEVWNEPDGGGIDPADYAAFYARTAAIVRAEQPDAVLYGGVVTWVNSDYVGEFLDHLADEDGIDLLDGITYHPYLANPDTYWIFDRVDMIRAHAARHGLDVEVRQGENGAPSTPGSFGALGDLDWTELSQSKWFLRRVLNDLGHDVSTSVFTISDLHYPSKVNTKGLLQTNTDKSIRYAKPSYYAVQTAASVFDSTMSPLPDYGWTATGDADLTLYAFEKRGTGRQAVAVWNGTEVPGDSNERTPVDLTVEKGEFKDPVYVDVRTGAVFDIPDADWSVRGDTYTFTDVPVYDSPVLVADRSAVTL